MRASCAFCFCTSGVSVSPALRFSSLSIKTLHRLKSLLTMSSIQPGAMPSGRLPSAQTDSTVSQYLRSAVGEVSDMCRAYNVNSPSP